MNTKKISAIIFLVVAAVAIIFGFLCYEMSAGSYESSETYGGDAYTGIQNAAAQTANNVYYTSILIGEIASYAFFFVAVVFVALAVIKFLESRTPAPIPTVPSSQTTIEE